MKLLIVQYQFIYMYSTLYNIFFITHQKTMKSFINKYGLKRISYKHSPSLGFSRNLMV